MTVTIPSTPVLLRRLVPVTAFAAAVIVMITTAPAVQADPLPEPGIKDYCDVNHGTYNSYVDALGNRWSTCCYRLGLGDEICEVWENGELQAPPPGSTRPPPPGQLPTQILIPGKPPPANNPG